jgi:SAM-dependent methyltransferase
VTRSRKLSLRQRTRLDIQRDLLASWAASRAPGPVRVADFGTEYGDSGRIAREVLDYDARIIGCELWEPNAVGALMVASYHAIAIEDARTWDSGPFDVGFCCELIEHMPREDGEKLLRDLSARMNPGGILIVSAPTGWLPQGAIDGNPHEEHVSAWEPADLEALGFTIREVVSVLRLFVAFKRG